TADKSEFSALSSYRESKFAQMLMTRHLDKLHGDFLFTAAVHPGFVNSDLFYRRMPDGSRMLLKPIEWIGYIFGILKTPYKGADTSIWLSAEKEPIPSGKYWSERREREWPKAVENDTLSTELWDWSGKKVASFLGEA
ncbi:MAG: hypothetical protein P8X57_01070, partial [Cyclobacteriaceae bacterium]